MTTDLYDRVQAAYNAAFIALLHTRERNDGWVVLARHAMQRARWATDDFASSWEDVIEAYERVVYYASHAPGEQAREVTV